MLRGHVGGGWQQVASLLERNREGWGKNWKNKTSWLVIAGKAQVELITLKMAQLQNVTSGNTVMPIYFERATTNGETPTLDPPMVEPDHLLCKSGTFQSQKRERILV